ncbi:hypothetical protein [Ornithinimicrobium murale]|uniref:hypothetical protein n=1 Tax=Ornithinimicrobium murale TaxID=1050153 RepID=UPI000E0D2CCF|nr:hypothetical protein [Ornithinimicrobium murale]
MSHRTKAPDRAIVLAAAEAMWHHDNADSPEHWRQMAWDDMGGSEPSEERVEYELRAEAVLLAVAEPLLEATVAAIQALHFKEYRTTADESGGPALAFFAVATGFRHRASRLEDRP